MTFDCRADLVALKRFSAASRRLSIGLLCGPKSAEDRVYFEAFPFAEISSGFVYKALRELGFRVKVIDNTKPGLERRLRGVDLVFINMHGEFGEDGCVQGLLQYYGIPHTASGLFGSSIGISKLRFKALVTGLGYEVPAWFELDRVDESTLERGLRKLKAPAFLKMVDGGSSIGMHLLEDRAAIPNVYRRVLRSPYRSAAYFLEKLARGREFTVAMLDLPTQRVVLPILEMAKLNAKSYDEQMKIRSQRGEDVIKYIVPGNLTPHLAGRIRRTTLGICRAAEARGFARLDLILSGDRPRFLEMNTIPGLQKDSLFLLCAKAAGLSEADVMLALLYNAVHHKSS